ncbi:MAG TPA: hypothetical protein VD907_04365 [Verrucomicrobiae bacterium]|nr:hypothetical protein [Verrucomicrobiae bacterium]
MGVSEVARFTIPAETEAIRVANLPAALSREDVLVVPDASLKDQVVIQLKEGAKAIELVFKSKWYKGTRTLEIFRDPSQPINDLEVLSAIVLGIRVPTKYSTDVTIV